MNFMPAGAKAPLNHKHKQNEEVYIFLKGDGTMTLDGQTVAVKEGSCVRVQPQAVRTIIFYLILRCLIGTISFFIVCLRSGGNCAKF